MKQSKGTNDYLKPEQKKVTNMTTMSQQQTYSGTNHLKQTEEGAVIITKTRLFEYIEKFTPKT